MQPRLLLPGLAPLCAFVAVLATAAVATPLYALRALAPGSNATLGRTPDQDPFYTCPRGFAATQAGAILRQRDVSFNLTASGPAKFRSAQQILYRTVDVFGQPSCTVSTVLQPFNQQRYPTRVLSYQVAEDSPAIRCAPSYQLLTRGNETTTALESILITLALDKGYIVTIPDYEGPQSGFTVGTLAASTVLDGIRATLQVGASIIPDPDTARVALFGYSGGSLASGWAMQQASVYAPELAKNLVGAVLGGHIVNIKHILLNINNGRHSNLVASGIAGQRNVSPALAAYLGTVLRPNGTALLADVNAKCIAEIFARGEKFDFFSSLRIPQAELFAHPTVNASLSSGILGQPGTPVPQVPLFVYNSVEDEIIVPADVDAWVADLCARGAPSVTHLRIASGEHEITAALGAPAAFNWLDARFAGGPVGVRRGCVRVEEAAPLLDPLALVTLGAAVLSQLKLAAGGRLGPLLGF